MIDVIGYLDSRGIDYRAKGKNVATNDVNIDCIYCGEDGKHMGVHRENGTLHCWRCGFEDLPRYPSFVDLIKEIDGCSIHEAFVIAKKFSDGFISEPAKDLYKRRRNVLLPDELENFFDPIERRHRDYALGYLIDRGFGHTEIIKYKLGFCSTGRYAMRIIIPVYAEGKLVTFTGRDYMGVADRDPDHPRYKACSAGESYLRPFQTLYCIDEFSGHFLRIVEGPTDVWRMGDNKTVGLFSNKLSRFQRSLVGMLVDKFRIDSISVILDDDSYHKGRRVAEELSAFCGNVKSVRLIGGDVASKTRDEILQVESITPRCNF